ncbi:MAG: sugar phosphate isomerase/epimerase [Verrucomicrobiota bacterium]|jgi:sugar phosphate isomerase/epimerase|nr:sugar phosphate isomerase/epimerase [Verrucomicrobiota bacterium]
MKLSVSSRIAEGFLSKEEAIMTLPEFCDLAVGAGYKSICMRASQIGIQTPAEEVARGARLIQDKGLEVTMISGDFDIVYNNMQGPRCLHNISPYLDLAEQLGAKLIRICIKTEDDIQAAKKAADEAAERHLSLVHQCHVQSMFETVDQIENCLRSMDRPNLGLIYEAANLEECRQDYGRNSIQRLAPWIKNVYLQNQKVKSDGAITLDTWTHGPISFDIMGIVEPGGVDFAEIFTGLKQVGYDGIITVHQSAPEDGSSPMQAATDTARFLQSLM